MRIFNIFVNLLLIFVTVPFLSYPIQTSSKDAKISSYNFRYSADITYDDILDLIHAIEEDRLKAPISLDEINRINRFIASLAQEGILESTPEFEKDREDLSPDIIDFLSILVYGQDDSISNPSKDLELKSPMKPIIGAWDKSKKFIQKYKQPIVIGAAIVIAQTATVVALVAAASTDNKSKTIK